MPVVEVEGLTHRYGAIRALSGVDMTVPEGAVYALLGPNGAGKTTLLQALAGLRRPTAGRARVLGREAAALDAADRAVIGYVAEGQRLPERLRLEELESYLAPLYAGWDRGLADELRRRFRLDSRRRIGTLSRGERMKAALLCALAPRPRLLLMDEPFTGMDALVKDELVRGLLESAGGATDADGAAGGPSTVVIASHDLAELEALADWVGFLDGGRLLLSEPMETVRERFLRVEVVTTDGAATAAAGLPPEWLAVERVGARVSFLTSRGSDRGARDELRRRFPGATRIEVRSATLREVFVALAARGASATPVEEVGA